MIDLENVFRINLDLSRGQEKPILSTSQIGNYLPTAVMGVPEILDFTM